MTETLVTFSEDALRALFNDPTLTPGRARACSAGLNRLPGRLEFLVPRAGADEPRPTGDEPRVVVLPHDRPERLARALDDVPFYAPPGALAAVVALGVGPASGRLAGACRVGGVLRPLDGVRVPSAGMTAIGLTPSTHTTDAGGGLPWPEEEVLSRTIGALGEAAWRRLRAWHVALVGCGRTGSQMALGLRRLGLRRLTLLDPDRLEPHNLGEMDTVAASDVGRPKAEALAERLVDGAARVTAVPTSVLSLEGLVALKPADLLVCCADSAAARLATALLASLFLKPLLDIGTGVLHGPGPGGRRLGADVRLVLPGRCLLCLGGVADFDAARRELLQGATATPAADWQRERRGSLRSLNAVAVGLGLRLLEDVATGVRTASAWLHLDTDATGLPMLEARAPSHPNCPVCRRCGRGDAGVQSLRDLLSGLSLATE